jgi:hypothetical protein
MTLEINNLYEYISYSHDVHDFMNRMFVFCQIIKSELLVRLNDELDFPFQCVEIVDSINTDVEELVDDINETHFLEDQPKVDRKIFMKIIEAEFPDLETKYHYYKNVILN